MALLIDSSIEILGNVKVDSLYIRFYYSVDAVGQNIHTVPYVYTSKDSYMENLEYKVENITSIPNYMDFPYIREIDGSDPLAFVHSKYQNYLSTDKTRQVPVYSDSSTGLDYDPSTGKWFDPSTGDVWNPLNGNFYDSSTGQIVTEEEIYIPKLANIDDILIIDLP
jgi:hypothetical protein